METVGAKTLPLAEVNRSTTLKCGCATEDSENNPGAAADQDFRGVGRQTHPANECTLSAVFKILSSLMETVPRGGGREARIERPMPLRCCSGK